MHRAWGAYPETVLAFPEADLVVDLRRPLTPVLRQRLAAGGLGGPFGVVTACNPLGHQLDEPANRRLTTLLGSRIAGYGQIRLAHGSSPDGSHREPGWAIAAPLDEVLRLASAFLQNAVFWYDGERFFIVPVHGAGEPTPLPAAPAQSP
jgi:hypothetical protein